MLKEGRKETLIAKYPTSEDLLTDYLTDSEIHKKTNYKYADWYLTQYFEIGSMEDIPEIEDGDEIIEKFDRYRKNLEKKDINQSGCFTVVSYKKNWFRSYTRNSVCLL